MMSNPIFTYKIGQEKEEKILKQANMHGGLNQALRKNGMQTQSNSFQAIDAAHKNGLITNKEKRICCQINQDGNYAKHWWKKIVENK